MEDYELSNVQKQPFHCYGLVLQKLVLEFILSGIFDVGKIKQEIVILGSALAVILSSEWGSRHRTSAN